MTMLKTKVLFSSLLAILSICSYAQEDLSEIQQSSIWMENFNADGKLDEWQQPLQAYNNDTHIAYSLANDDMYLYLAVLSNRTLKILKGGITLEIKQQEDKPASVTFPYNFTYDRRKDPAIATHPDRPRKITDIKEIEVNGISEVPAHTIPLINPYGIQAMATEIRKESDLFSELSDEGEPFYMVEIAVPLQYFGVSNPQDVPELDYRIGLRGIILSGGYTPSTFLGVTADGRKVPADVINHMKMIQLDLHTPSELTGTYRLARKPD